MDKKFILAVIVIFIVTMLFGFVNHGLVLADEYQATGLFRTDEDAAGHMAFMLLGHVALAVAFVWLYRQGREDKPWLGQGIRFGLWVAVLMVVSIYLIYYAVQPMPGMLVVRQIVYDTIGVTISGVVVAFMYR
jgi:hypothetical protein